VEIEDGVGGILRYGLENGLCVGWRSVLGWDPPAAEAGLAGFGGAEVNLVKG